MKGIIGFIFFVWGIASMAQEPVLKNYNIHDGLPSSEIYCVARDKKGFMWFATDRGIAKFDGYNFKVFTTANGMSENTVFEFFVHDDKLWFKTISAEVGYIQNDSVHTYQYNHLIRQVLTPNLLRYVLFSNEGHLLFTKEMGNGIKFFEIDNKGRIDSSKNIDNREIKRIYINNCGESIVTGYLDAKKIEIFSYETNEMIGSFQTTTASRVLFVCPSGKRNSFFLYCNYAVFHINNGGCTKIFDCGQKDVLSICSDEANNLWIGYRNAGFERHSAKNGYRRDLSTLNHLSISSICGDYEGGVWFTTLENAIYYLPPAQLLSFTEEAGLSVSKTIKIEKINDNVAVILADNSVMQKGANDKKFKTVGGKAIYHSDIGYSPNGYLYITSYQRKKIKLSTKNKHIYFYGAKNVYVGHNYIWTTTSNTIGKYNRDGKRVDELIIEGLSRLITIYEQKNGDLLIGTIRGLYLYKNNTFYELKKHHPLLSARISDIRPINNNKLVISTIGEGVLIIEDNDFSHPKQYTVSHGLASNICNVVLVDTDSLIWVGTNKGLCRINLKKHNQKSAILKLDINAGVASNEINSLCIVDKDLWVATSKGISIIPRKTITDEVPDIPVYMDHILMNGVMKSIDTAYNFSYNQNNISIFFTGLHYRSAGKLQYKYRINGDTNWYYTTNRSVVFNSLSPGSYTFEVGVVKPNGQSNPLWARYSFTIRPPIWRTWWFVLCSTLLVIGILVGIIYQLIAVRKNELHKKEQQDRKLAQLELEAIKAQINPHFIYNCLNSIQYFNYNKEYTLVKKYFGMLARLIRQTMKFSHELFITVDAEVNYLTNYLELEKIRYGEKLNFNISVSPDTKGTKVIPSMLIQPYVENALKHGIANIENNGNVRIDFLCGPGDDLLVIIEDNGPGFAAIAGDEAKEHFGMRLTDGRIASYNQLFDINITATIIDKSKKKPPTNGIRVEIIVPNAIYKIKPREKILEKIKAFFH
jgi:ligand-binding sensor domain-containing protein